MDIFIGTLANAGLIILGAGLGCLLTGDKFKRVGERIVQLFELYIITMGISGALKIDRPLFALVCMVLGTALGELLDIDKQFRKLGDFIQAKLIKGEGNHNFSEGFVQASLLFCIGSMTFMGAMEAGISHEHTIYFTKGMLDCLSGMTFAMKFGIGTAFSSIPVLIYQGLLVVLASVLAPVLTPETVTLTVAIGSLSLIGIGTNMLGITKLKVANFLPAMFIPIIWQGILNIIA